MTSKKIQFIIISIIFFIPIIVFAHQPRIVTEQITTKINNPEISQAFYGELIGSPAYYIINSQESFSLYINILSPEIKNADKDFSVDVNINEEIIFTLDGINYEWKSFYEEFAGDNYHEGPDKKITAGPGLYTLKVFSPDNIGKYVLVVGEKEEFPPAEIINTIKTLPKLKKDFFEKSPLTAFSNKIGLFLFIPILILIILVVAIMIFIKKRKK